MWSSYKRGNYPDVRAMAADIMPGAMADRVKLETTLNVLGTLPDGVRLGAYGDPAAMPVNIARQLVKMAGTRQGFTHQWRWLGGTPWPLLCMASCELPQQVAQAAALGWRCYVVYPEGLSEKEARRAISNASGRHVLGHCPASEVKGYLVSCATCPIQCDGARYGVKHFHVFNAAHGNPAAMARYRALGFDAMWRAYL
jgi:hypothetical protein